MNESSQTKTSSATDSGSIANPKWMTWTGRVISGLVVLSLTASAIMKLMKPKEVLDEFVRLGYTANHASGIGIVELTCVVIYLIPRTAVLGAILLTGYLGGAVATHVRLGESFTSPAIIGVLVWLGIFLRNPRMRALLQL